MGAVGRAGIMPAVKGSVVFVDGEIIAATGWADVLPRFVTGFEGVQVVKDRKRHAARSNSAFHCGSSLRLWHGLVAIRIADSTKG